jgi:uncharacterized protein YfbU (UPF0304 family)
LALLDDLKVKNIKILTHWDLIEPKKDEYFFEDLDWQVSEVEKRDGKIILVIGMKTGRWPECHIPQWAKNLPKENQQEKKQLDLEKLKFEGFDANNDPHYHYGKFMIEKLNLWEEHKDMYFNSHSQFPLIKYKKMLEFHSNKTKIGNYDLTLDDLIQMQELI